MDIGFGTPFARQLEFFRKKLALPTERWDDIQKAAHDRAFIVAGAAKADLLDDLQQALFSRMADGRGLEAFRKDFRRIVQQHGWTGWTGEGTKAGEAWRTKVIYQTNMSTSYAAGRYSQLMDPEFLKLRPWWRYVHADGVMYPRPLHLAWGEMRLTLRYDHPFWETHFPPNGWGCHCYVVAVDAPGEGDATAPPDGWDQINPKTGTQVGIDRGFDYAPGANVDTPLQSLLDQKLINIAAPIGAAMWESLAPVIAEERAQAFSAWIGNVLADPVSRGRMSVVGAIAPEILDWLAARAISPATAEITIDDSVIVGKKAVRHALSGDALTAAEWVALPELLSRLDRVVFDTRTGHLIYVLPSLEDGSVKVAVEFAYLVKKTKTETNMIVSSFRADPADIDGAIKGGQYQVVE